MKTQKSFVQDWKARCEQAGTADASVTFTFDNYKDEARKAGIEGMVLLRNENRALPFTVSDTVAVFGSRQWYEKAHSKWGFLPGGAGAGSVWGRIEMSPTDALRLQADNGRFRLYDVISEKYKADPETYVPSDEDIADAKAAGVNKAMFIVSRLEGEGGTEELWLGERGRPDSEAAPGEWYLSHDESAMIKRLCDSFDQVIVVLNSGNIIDTNWVKYGLDGRFADAVLCSWYGGHQGVFALAEVLSGVTPPMGKLAQTAADIKNYASTPYFGRSNYSNYVDDIFVGYRYFETFNVPVNYEFGFGLTYTTFDITDVTYAANDTHITVTAKVTNTGDTTSKEVVQVYASAPQMGTGTAKLSKPAKELVGFAKTKFLAAGESEILTVSFPIEEMASYDDTGVTGHCSAWVMEAGDYTIYVGNSVKNVVVAGVYTLPETKVTAQFTAKMTPVSLPERLLADGTYEQLKAPAERLPQAAPMPEVDSVRKEYDKTITFADVVSGAHTAEELVSQMTVEELASFTACTDLKGSSGNASVGGNDAVQERYGVPLGRCLDGPASPDTGRWSYPSGLTIACSFNVDVAANCGIAGGSFSTTDLAKYGCFMWQATGVNIHRSPLGGRNFEYYSEDPLITGVMAAATCLKAEQFGIGTVVKHMAVNNQETDRGGCDSRVSERALREIYLKGFEIALKVADPVSVMTSYNNINGVQSYLYREMLVDVARDEWGWTGMYMSDWDDIGFNTADMVNAGHHVKMGANPPARVYSDVITAHKEGKVSRMRLEENAADIVRALVRSRNEG